MAARLLAVLGTKAERHQRGAGGRRALRRLGAGIARRGHREFVLGLRLVGAIGGRLAGLVTIRKHSADQQKDGNQGNEQHAAVHAAILRLQVQYLQ